jgi:hypothetical protein
LAVEHAKGAAQVPEGEAPPGLMPEREAVFHPGQGHGVRRSVKGTPLADVNLDLAIR